MRLFRSLVPLPLSRLHARRLTNDDGSDSTFRRFSSYLFHEVSAGLRIVLNFRSPVHLGLVRRDADSPIVSLQVRVPLNTALLALQNLEAGNVFEDKSDTGYGIEYKALRSSLLMMQQVLNDGEQQLGGRDHLSLKC